VALSDTQRAQVRRYLGWSARYFQVDGQLEHAMTAVSDLPEDSALVGTLLTQLATLEAEMVAARKRLKAMAIGSIQLGGPMEMGQLRREGRRLTQQLATILGVDKRSDAFGTGGTLDNYVGR